MRNFLGLLCFLTCHFGHSQSTYWQQQADYEIEIELNTQNHRYEGKERITYTNNSPDSLKRVYFHLYNNAFQPGSMMDVRSRNIADPDRRVADRIAKLTPAETGWMHVTDLAMDRRSQQIEEEGTVLVVYLDEPIVPGQRVVFDLKFEAQVPIQIRRSGRDNSEGIDYSMAQWYPKVAEYDFMGWHPNPYIGREFHGVWGNFDVKITLPSEYTVAATGYLQNANKIGHGYGRSDEVQHKIGSRLTWHFVAPKVIDFVWAADRDYVHDKIETDNGTVLHFFYQDDTLVDQWKELALVTKQAFEFVSENFGEYPYKQYSVIQAGDGGMEYPMATLIVGHRNFKSVAGTTFHELVHSWYQAVLATNESLYPWMDEGFTAFVDDEAFKHVFYPDSDYVAQLNAYKGYYRLALSGKEEPMSTHADHYHTNYAYGGAAYRKGSVYLKQLEYIVGKEAFRKGMKAYFEEWKFKHPTPNDFIKVMETVAEMELHWYNNFWINTTRTIDYGIAHVLGNGVETYITLHNYQLGNMPVEARIKLRDGSNRDYYIPLRIMRGSKKVEEDVTVLPDWPWTYPQYTFKVPFSTEDILEISINRNHVVADLNKKNDKIILESFMQETFVDVD
jgi:hypothetical protein